MRRLLLVSLAVVAIGCKESTEPLTLGTTDLNVVGSYGLNFAAGQPLPLLAGTSATQELDLVADTMVIAKDNTWAETSYFILTTFADGTQTNNLTVSSGTYAVNAGAIDFTMLVGGSTTFTGSVTGSILSLIYNNGKYLYSR